MTRIEWANHAHNVVDGCSPASPGCDNCYAARLAGARMQHHIARIAGDDGTVVPGRRSGLVTIGKRADDKTKARYVYNGRVALNTDKLRAALKIPRAGGKAGPRTFWNHQSDTFHELLSFPEIATQFAVMAARPDLQFMVLTKRPERAREFFAWVAGHDLDHATLCRAAYKTTAGGLAMAALAARPYEQAWPLPNVALGVSAEDQRRWDERVHVLLELPAAMRFVSIEPMIGPIDPRLRVLGNGCHKCHGARWYNPLDGSYGCRGYWRDWARFGRSITERPPDEPACGYMETRAKIDQVIIGAESGPGARPMDLRWAQDLAKTVLDAQPIGHARNMDPEVGGWMETGPVAHPALFVKQANVCPTCDGKACYTYVCAMCTGTENEGRSGKVRKGCPHMFVPGHGTQSWAQFPEGW